MEPPETIFQILQKLQRCSICFFFFSGIDSLLPQLQAMTSLAFTSGKDVGDFEFGLEDQVAMLPTYEPFSDGKLVPLQVPVIRPSMAPEDRRRHLRGSQRLSHRPSSSLGLAVIFMRGSYPAATCFMQNVWSK